MCLEINFSKDDLKDIYLENPCSVQATALWKTFYMFKNLYSKFEFTNEEVSKIMLWNEELLHTYWSKNTTPIENNILNNFKTLILHKNQTVNLKLENNFKCEEYFKLKIDYKYDLKPISYKDYYVKTVDIKKELKQVSNVICSCYKDIKPTEEEVFRWTNYPVFNKDLWIWVIDKISNKIVGLGIGELDTSINEGVLEWIQVIPEYRKKGIGTIIVKELLVRLSSCAEFVTVSGKVDNDNKPENLYRKCGFQGNDIWCIFTKIKY